jgi:hypothetical protein
VSLIRFVRGAWIVALLTSLAPCATAFGIVSLSGYDADFGQRAIGIALIAVFLTFLDRGEWLSAGAGGLLLVNNANAIKDITDAGPFIQPGWGLILQTVVAIIIIAAPVAARIRVRRTTPAET